MQTVAQSSDLINSSDADVIVFASPAAPQFDNSASRDKLAGWLLGLGMAVAAGRFRDCGEGGRGWVGVCPAGHEIYHPFGCMLRVCPRCATASSHKLAEKYTPVIKDLASDASSVMTLKHIVLTTSICLLDYVKVSRGVILRDPLLGLREHIRILRGSVADLMRDKFGEDERVGWAIGVEFGANFMLHFHVLALCPYWNKFKLSDAWHGYSLGAGRIVDIGAVGAEIEDVERAVGYVSKYVTKPLGKRKSVLPGESDTSARVAAFVELHGSECLIAALAFVFKGMRRFQTYGAFYDLDFPDDLEVCSECGSELYWLPEFDWVCSDVWSGRLLDLIKTNKSSGGGARSPPFAVQMGFDDWLSDVLF